MSFEREANRDCCMGSSFENAMFAAKLAIAEIEEQFANCGEFKGSIFDAWGVEKNLIVLECSAQVARVWFEAAKKRTNP